MKIYYCRECREPRPCVLIEESGCVGVNPEKCPYGPAGPPALWYPFEQVAFPVKTTIDIRKNVDFLISEISRG